jgi:hypothetical protein
MSPFSLNRAPLKKKVKVWKGEKYKTMVDSADEAQQQFTQTS